MFPSRLSQTLTCTITIAIAAIGAGRAAHAAPAAPCTTDNLIAGKAPWQQRDVTGNPALVTDGKAPPDGASWDAPAAIRLEGTAGSLTYDLGKPTLVGAFFLQADANDSYKVSGSSDGQSFTQLVQAANVVDRGHGLRARTMQIEPTTIRYVRVGEGDGDNAFSIAEFAAYCRPPTPFPPVFNTVEAPMIGVSTFANARSAAPSSGATSANASPFFTTRR